MRRLATAATVLAFASLWLSSCARQKRPTETTPSLPHASDEERHAARFGHPDQAKETTSEVTAPTDDAEKAPGGTVYGLDGKPFDLAAAYGKRHLVLVFYRGGWCRYCRRQLGELQDRYREILRAGADLCAVSTESADLGTELAKKLGLEYPVLVDPHGQAAREWGVLDEQTGIAKLSTFVVERGGSIVYRHVATEAADFPATEEVMAKVTTLPREH